MKWIKKAYIPDNAIKYHIVHPDASSAIDESIKNEYNCAASSEELIDILKIDPGGSIMLNNPPINHSVDGLELSVKPEHIFGANIVWSSYAKKLEEETLAGEKLVRISLDSFTCAVIPEGLYVKIGAWLASISAIGQAARAELAAAMEGNVYYHVYVPDAIEVDEFDN